MSYKDNQDLRAVGAGGWSYVEHELWSVFAPLVGPSGVAVYAAMCRLIPLAAADPDKQVSVRRVAIYSCVGKSKCAEVMRDVIRLGMIIETKYLDGRKPTYKIPKLRDLAKVGEAELLRRLGVRPGDTAPFDQEAARHRERTARAAKRRDAQGSEERERDLPLLAGSAAAEAEGVRPADTDKAAGMTEDASATRTHVSAHDVSVSARNVSVSAKTGKKAAPLTGEEEDEERRKQPPTPAAAGEEGDADDQAMPSLPTEHCLFGDPGFATALDIASQWVVQQLGITKRRMRELVAGQLHLYCRNHRSEPLQDVAAKMVRQGKAMHRDRELLKHAPWSWENFIAAGHWQRPLPYESAERRRDAGVGMARPDPEQQQRSNHEYMQRIRAYIGGRADEIAAAGSLDMWAAELRAIASGVGEGTAIDTLDESLQDLEDRIYTTALEALAPSELAAIDEQVDGKMRELRLSVNDEQRTKMRHQLRRRFVFGYRKLPSLSLFYMGPSHT